MEVSLIFAAGKHKYSMDLGRAPRKDNALLASCQKDVKRLFPFHKDVRYS